MAEVDKAKNQFNVRIGNLEVRNSSVKDGLLEMIQWGDSFCWMIAYWSSRSDWIELNFIGDRPFDSRVDPLTFWTLAQMGQRHLEGKLVEGGGDG